MTRASISPALLRAVVRLLERQIIDARKRELETIARRMIRRHRRYATTNQTDAGLLISIYGAELARLEIRRRGLEVEQVKLRPLDANERAELARNRAERRYITAALRRVRKTTRDMQLSPKQREVLLHAVAGEDRIIPERYDPGPPPFVMPERRWHVPPGHLVPSGSAEYVACRVLARRGMLVHDRVVSESHPNGLGGYAITAKGRRAL